MELKKFEASWCGPCKALDKTLGSLVSVFVELNVDLVRIDVDECEKLAEDYNIRTVPVLVLEKDGKEVGRLVGNVPKNTIENFLRNA